MAPALRRGPTFLLAGPKYVTDPISGYFPVVPEDCDQCAGPKAETGQYEAPIHALPPVDSDGVDDSDGGR